MAIQPYLAMTAAEFSSCQAFPPRIAWMACHFSPYATGLSNLPRTLPPDSLLIVSDIIPIHGHDPGRVATQLEKALAALNCRAVLLDFQRPDVPETQAMADHLNGALPCPVITSQLYCRQPHGAVLLNPCPPGCLLREHLLPWQDHEIWLEIATGSQTVRLRQDGAVFSDLFPAPPPQTGHRDEALHCHYTTELADSEAVFTLWRTPEDMRSLLDEGESLGITGAVALYQELKENEAEA